MAIPLFLAAHPSEVAVMPEHYAWMACRFSGNGLTDLPRGLPEGTMVVLTDEIPPVYQDPEQTAEQLAALNCDSILLDFQRPDCPLTRRIAAEIVKYCTCPVGVTELYADGLSCAVFLSPIPPDRPPEEHLAPWQGRELWLDLSPSPTRITVMAEGSKTTPLTAVPTPEHSHRDRELFCHYRISTELERVTFDLWRTKEDLSALLTAAESLGITRAIGLYQELGR